MSNTDDVESRTRLGSESPKETFSAYRRDTLESELLVRSKAGQDGGQSGVLFLNLSRLNQIIDEGSSQWDHLSNVITDVFSKPEKLAASFLRGDAVSLDRCPVDVAQVRQAYEQIYSKIIRIMIESAEAAIRTVITRVDMDDYLAMFVILLEGPFMLDTIIESSFFDIFVQTLGNLLPSSRRKMVSWLSSAGYYDETGLLRLVSIFQQVITLRLLSITPNSPNKDETVMHATRCLSILYDINEITRYLPYQEFYNDAINEQIDIKEDFPHWKAKEGFSFCNYPFVLNAATKSDILKVESMVQMRHELQDAFFRAMFVGVNSPYLILDIRREHIIRDTMFQLADKHARDLKKQLRISFVGEDGVDEGGVQKEFFQLAVRELFDPKFGMFTINEESHLFWYRPNPLDDEYALEEHKLVGRLIGLAIYNSVILDVHFPLALWRKLMGRPVGLEDLKELDPTLGKGLQQLLDFDGDVESTYERTFQVEFDLFGTQFTFELKKNGSEIPLTNSNRYEYVDLYVDYYLHKSVEKQFQAFKEGFDLVCADSAITLFRPEEVELLVCGSSDLDFTALEKVTIYDGGFTRETPVIQFFWETVHGFTLEQKKRLLFFATGTDRVPIGGLSKLQFVIAKNGTDSNRLPSSHTCFNVLLLCEYSSREKLEERLLTAIQNAEGFGMI